MKKKWIIVAGALALLLFAMGMGQVRKELPPEFSLQTLDGKIMDYAALKGAPVVIVFGATWCPECRIEAPEVQKAYLAYKDKGVVFLGVYGGQNDKDVRQYAEECRITFPAGRDQGQAAYFSVRAIPSILYFASDGRLVKRTVGVTHFDQISAAIEKVIEKK
jgi:thiol-disulfide isomerase/thioredoxin